MKQVIAIVKPYLAEKILESLRLAPLEAVDVYEVKGIGRQKSYLDHYTDSEYSEAYLPKLQISAWVEDEGQRKSYKNLSQWLVQGELATVKFLF